LTDGTTPQEIAYDFDFPPTKDVTTRGNVYSVILSAQNYEYFEGYVRISIVKEEGSVGRLPFRCASVALDFHWAREWDRAAQARSPRGAYSRGKTADIHDEVADLFRAIKRDGRHHEIVEAGLTKPWLKRKIIL